jgi:hypothetical protein
MRLYHCTLFCFAAILSGGCSATTHTPKLDPYTNVNPNWNLSQPFGVNAKPTPEKLTEIERRQAVRFDPFPEDDIGPSVDGGRPRDFGQQLPETMRSRWTR